MSALTSVAVGLLFLSSPPMAREPREKSGTAMRCSATIRQFSISSSKLIGGQPMTMGRTEKGRIWPGRHLIFVTLGKSLSALSIGRLNKVMQSCFSFHIRFMLDSN